MRLKYGSDRSRVIQGMRRISRPGPAGVLPGRRPAPHPGRPRRGHRVHLPGTACPTARRAAATWAARSCARCGDEPHRQLAPITAPRTGSIVDDRRRQRSPSPDRGAPGSHLPRPGASASTMGWHLRVARRDDQRQSRALHGLSRALLANMVVGVSNGFTRELQCVGVGYRAAPPGDHPGAAGGLLPPGAGGGARRHQLRGARADPDRGAGHRQGTGRPGGRRDPAGVRPPEPYKGKGIRYSDEKMRRKAGKAGVSGR